MDLHLLDWKANVTRLTVAVTAKMEAAVVLAEAGPAVVEF